MNKLSQTVFLVLALAFLASCLASCDESKASAFVYGTIRVSPGNGTADFEGTLENSNSAPVFGACKMSGDTFSFTVGHADVRGLEGVDADAPTFLSISGISGPPVEGVFDLESGDPPSPKDDEDLEKTLGEGASVWVGTDEDDWSFNGSEADCNVELFATPVAGEVIWEDELNKTFDFYVRIRCDSVTDNAAEGNRSNTQFNTLDAELYFENCG